MDLREMAPANKRMVVLLVIKLIGEYERIHRDYLDDCAADRRRGYRPQTCEHGVNQWVDYDPICGLCEYGHSLGDPMFRRQLALENAKERLEQSQRMFRLLNEAKDLGLLDLVKAPEVVERSLALVSLAD